MKSVQAFQERWAVFKFLLRIRWLRIRFETYIMWRVGYKRWRSKEYPVRVYMDAFDKIYVSREDAEKKTSRVESLRNNRSL